MKSAEDLKRNDQINLLEICAKFTATGEWEGTFTYPTCGYDLVQQDLATKDKKITNAGKAVLWFLNKGHDPTNSKAIETFSLNSDSQPQKRSKPCTKRIEPRSWQPVSFYTGAARQSW